MKTPRPPQYWTKRLSGNRRLRQALRPRLNEYIPITPHPKQAAFLLLDCREAFYGGAAGPGKSWALLAAALQYVDEPSYRALILRRQLEDLRLPGNLIDVAHEWLGGTDAVWHEQKHFWKFPSGAELHFGHMEHERDRFKYKGSRWDFVGIDELTQFTEIMYTYMLTRLRRVKGSKIPVRLRGASNPGDEGHEWVRERFVDERPEGRTNQIFIKAVMADNPHLDIEDYLKGFEAVDPITRQQLVEGDWSAREGGGKFKREWFKIVDDYPADLEGICRGWDIAATEAKAGKKPSWTVGLALGKKDRSYYMLDVVRLQGTPHTVDKVLLQTTQMDGEIHGEMLQVDIEQEGGSSGPRAAAEYVTLLAGYDVHTVRPKVSKTLRANPVSAQAEAGNVYIVRGPWNKALIEELEAFPNGTNNDQADALSLAFARLTGGPGLLEYTRRAYEEQQKRKMAAKGGLRNG